MRFPRIFCLFVVLSSLRLYSQSPNANLNGLVSDPSRAAVAGAEVIAVSDVTGVQYATKTNNEGIYVIPNLPPGPYRLQVSKVGFKTVIKPDIVLNVQDALSINFALPIGATFEVLTVEGGAPLVNTESASVSTVVDQNYLQNMPLNGRSFQDLILLTPGIVTQTPENTRTAVGQTGEFSVNGQRPEENYYIVDGVSANMGAAAGFNMVFSSAASGSIPGATALGTTQALVSVDDLQEFRVQSSTYSAEYGRNPGGQFSFETKSGTNQWHGTAYDYLRNGIFDAKDWFNDYFDLKEPDLRQNDFGGTFGGPLSIPYLYNGKDKTFVFVSYEGLRLGAPQAGTINYVPDGALRSSAPTALQPVLNAFPLPNGPNVEAGIAEYIASWSNPASLNSSSVRFDETINNKARLFFRFSRTTSDSFARGTSAGFSTPTVESQPSYTMRTYTAGVSGLFSSRLSNEFRFNYSSNEVNDPSIVNSFGGSTPTDLTLLTGLPAGSSVIVALDYGGYVSLLQQQKQSGSQKQWNLVDAVNFSLGRHRLKFGADYRKLLPRALPSLYSLNYYFGFTNGVQDVERNDAYTLPSLESPGYPLYTNFSSFFQDEWKVSQHVNLSLGVRWEVNPAPGAAHGLVPYTIDFVSPNPDTWTLAPQGTRLWKTTFRNLAPRLGVAYILHDERTWQTVLRGGAGVFFDTAQQTGSQGFGGPGFIAYGSFQSGAFPVSPPFPSIVNPPVPPFSFLYAFDPHLQLPYTVQWNGSLEQALGASQALTLSYVGAHGARLLKENVLVPTATALVNGNFYYYNNALTSDYGSLQLQFRRRLSRGLTVLASYTWSHCLDYGSQNYVYGYFQRGNCDFDVRHHLASAMSYDVPNVGHSRILDAMLHHWGIDNRVTVQTAFPVTLSGNATVDPASGQYYYQGLDLVPGQPLYVYGAQCATVYANLYGNTLPCPGDRAINPNAFSTVGSGYGDAPRNFARGFSAWQMDLAVRRTFVIHEELKMQLRAEAFNVFNQPNFGTINSTYGENTFGQATATLANSLGILSPLYQMGGARSLQFAVRLLF